MSDCIFCKALPRIAENDAAYAIFDIKPVSQGHALIIFKRHFEQVFEATPTEWAAAQELLLRMKVALDRQYRPAAYNVWVNCGSEAGQIVMHAHIHLIPRYAGQAVHIHGGHA